MNRSEIIEVLETYHITPSRKMGQNFLIESDTAQWIVDALEVTEEDCVLEIGPGTGALSQYLVKKAKKVILIEYDARLAAYLKERFALEKKVTVIHADGARIDTRPFYAFGKVKVLGNLPYAAGGAILRNFFEPPMPIQRAVLMLQKEFIERMIAPPSCKDYGVLSLRMQSIWKQTPLKVVKPECFYPRPAIDSLVLLCEPLDQVRAPYDRKLFDSLVRRGFSQRRKQLHKQLPSSPPWSEVSHHLGLDTKVRAENLTVDQWIELARIYDTHPLKGCAQSPLEVFDVVDDSDRVIGKATRGEVHAQGLLHRAVHIWVVNAKGELFLQKRSVQKEHFPQRWDSSAAGHVEQGESVEDCCVRELREELGISLSVAEAHRLFKLPACRQTGGEFVSVFLVLYSGKIHYPCSEIEAGGWFSFELLEEWIIKHPECFASGFLACWEYKEKCLQVLSTVL